MAPMRATMTLMKAKSAPWVWRRSDAVSRALRDRRTPPGPAVKCQDCDALIGLLDYQSDVVASHPDPPYRWSLQILESRNDHSTGRRAWRLGPRTEDAVVIPCGNCGRPILPPITADALGHRLDPPFDAGSTATRGAASPSEAAIPARPARRGFSNVR